MIKKVEGKKKKKDKTTVDQSERLFFKKWQVARKTVKSRVHNDVCGEEKTVGGWVGEGSASVCVCRGGKVRPLIDVKLVFEVEEETRGLASEATRGCEGEI